MLQPEFRFKLGKRLAKNKLALAVVINPQMSAECRHSGRNRPYVQVVYVADAADAEQRLLDGIGVDTVRSAFH
ncbi:hypothetical protein D3C84_1095670 [compost metagenome]